MRSSFARFAGILLITVTTTVGCRSLYDSPDTNNASRTSGAITTDTPGSADDPFSSATGFFSAGGNDVPGGTPARPGKQEAEEGEETASHFRAIQIDPLYEATAGPKFVMPFDIDNDGLMDLLTGWNQSQPVQILLQRRDQDGELYFVTVNMGGTAPIALIGDLDMADFNGDGWLDIAVLVKETGSVGVCPTPGETSPFKTLDSDGMGMVQILFSPGNAAEITDGDAWQEVRLERSHLPGRRDVEIQDARAFPEFNGYTGIAVGEIDGINGPDIVVAYNPAKCEYYGDEPTPINRIVLYTNPGGQNMYESGILPFSVIAVGNAPAQVPVTGVMVTLDAGGSFSQMGIAGLGPYIADVNSTWSQTSGESVNLSVSPGNPHQATFTAPTTDTTLGFLLYVESGGASDFEHVNVVVGEPANLPPVIEASEDQTVVADVGNPGSVVVRMSAIASDPNGDTLTYAWAQVSGDPVALSGAGSSTANFKAPPSGGELRFRVTVTDGTLIASDLVVITAGMWSPVVLETAAARAGDVHVQDIDLDDDNDILFTFPDAITSNIAWVRNPVDQLGPQGTLVRSNWQSRPVGQVDSYADMVTLGDIDMDGFDDVLVRSAEGPIVQWFRHPGSPESCTSDADCGDSEICIEGLCVLEPIFPPPNPAPPRVTPDRFNFPWEVYTIGQYAFGKPAGIAIGDLNGDGLNEVAVAAGGVVCWYDALLAQSRYAMWYENFVVDDTKANGATDDPSDPNFQDSGTVIFNLSIIDIDDDGYGDIFATFDRRVESGLADDTLVWFRNTLGDQTDTATPDPEPETCPAPKR
ncbi:MAG: VCBS repeat-containing protein [Phycisphaerae bacterium]|nr:VCBS repeat-containing protein [Phycisphaerae bacterium]